MTQRRVLPGIVLALGCLIAATAMGQAASPSGHAAAPPLPRWFYYPVNLLVEGNLATLEGVWRRAAQAGYTHVLLSDYKFGKLDEMGRGYFAHVERVKKLAAELHLQIVPAIFLLGYSESLLAHDPNLAEGLPVREALFVVHQGQARCVADEPAGWPGDSLADMTHWDWHDPSAAITGSQCDMVNPAGNCRVMKKVKVTPFRQFHLYVQIRTQEFRGTPEVKVLADGRALNYQDLGVQATQDWTTHHVVFNTLDHGEVAIYLGVWGGGRGTLQWRTPVLEEVGLLNVLRREGTPLVVRTESGRTLEEGRDFTAVVDPRMGCVPWAGSYEVWHEPPALSLTSAAPVAEGGRLRVSFYHAITTHDGQVMICPGAPATVELLRDQARRMTAAWGTKGYFMEHDEIRTLGWDESCTRRRMTSGQILADNVHTCIDILRQANPGGDIYVWSDMFDPHHNAHDNYYLVHGDLAGSWEGLDQDVIMVVWAYELREKSMEFFARRGQRMLLAGYYDAPAGQVAEQARGWLATGRGWATPPRVTGIMYTTWENNFTQLEAFAAAVGSH